MPNSNYSSAEKLLHYLALGSTWIQKASFDIDHFFTEKTNKYVNGKHVFISGLARAGTTILMRTLYETNQFQSLTYRDMPFVLMPRLWHPIAKSFLKEGGSQERAHGDGISIDYHSPEAFEEIFWRTFTEQPYILHDRMIPPEIGGALIKRFQLYVNHLLEYSGECPKIRYLSKNNNNVLRLNSIRKAFADSIIIIPFRDPVSQAASLLAQHQRFCAIHRKDKFSYHYMNWLGHHEFGLSHKPFCFAKNVGVLAPDFESDNINYWLRLWIDTYKYLINNAPNHSVFVCFEELGDPDNKMLKNVFELTDLEFDSRNVTFSFTPPKRHVTIDVHDTLKKQSQAIYKKMQHASSL